MPASSSACPNFSSACGPGVTLDAESIPACERVAVDSRVLQAGVEAAKEQAEEQLLSERQRVAEAMQAEQEAELEQRDAELVRRDSMRESQLSEAAQEAAAGVCILLCINEFHYALLWIIASCWVSLCFVMDCYGLLHLAVAYYV